jgi:3-hydroxyacyl-CoA dehydrogenase
MGRQAMKAEEVRKTVVVGGGVMGSGIALVLARVYPVELVDLSQEVLKRSFTSIRSHLSILVDNGLWSRAEGEAALGRIQGQTDLAAALAGADFVLEAVPEDLELKKEVFRELDRTASPEAILSTNSSSFRTTELAAATNRPGQVVGVHWINPPYIIPVVEIVRGDATSDQTVELARGLIARLGWRPVVCKDVPGFIVNRFQHALLNVALMLVEQGVASIEDIDTACRLSFCLRLPIYGPLRAHDMAVNKKTSLATAEYIYREVGHPIFEPSPLLRQKVEAGELGIVSGKGWYDYSGQSLESLQRDRDQRLIQMLKFLEGLGLR